MRSAMGRISGGREPGIPATQRTSSPRVIVQALIQADAPQFWGPGCWREPVPPQSGQTSSFRNFSTRFMPFSSLTLDRAFSTVYTALK